MTATEKLQTVLQGNYNLEFEKAEVLLNGSLLGVVNETIYIRQGGPFGGIMTVLNYSYAIDEIQALGAMCNFHYGQYDFFSNWKVIKEKPLSLLQQEDDKINSIVLTAEDTPTTKDIKMDINIGPFMIRCSKCRYIF